MQFTRCQGILEIINGKRIITLDKKLELKLGEIKCDKCQGAGIIDTSTYVVKLPGISYISTTSTESLLVIKCKKCNGEGKLDWIENVIGKKGK